MRLLACPACVYRVTVSIDWGAIEKSSASEYATWPRGMVTELLPLKVRPASEAVSMPLTPTPPPAGRATDAAVMGRSLPPKVLEIWTRMRSPPMDMCRVWRRVASRNMELPPFCCSRPTSAQSRPGSRVAYEGRRRQVALLDFLRHGGPGGHPVVVVLGEASCPIGRGDSGSQDGENEKHEQPRTGIPAAAAAAGASAAPREGASNHPDPLSSHLRIQVDVSRSDTDKDAKTTELTIAVGGKWHELGSLGGGPRSLLLNGKHGCFQISDESSRNPDSRNALALPVRRPSLACTAMRI
ncbi:hypothetical protein VTK73DRAFT_3860 [Phialemonium thermophilum]|uniref:Uncharacterized protein n=1 Tax=Phialemonium thermophilum TaxID=223376 RepID=A0ABR3VFZ9_9PEZI